MISPVILKIRHTVSCDFINVMNVTTLTFFFNLTLNSTLSFPCASLSVFCDLRCRRLEGVAGEGIPSMALVESDGEAGSDGEDLAAFLRGGIANRSKCDSEIGPVSELLLLNSNFR